MTSNDRKHLSQHRLQYYNTHNSWPTYMLVKCFHVGQMLVDWDLTNILVNWLTPESAWPRYDYDVSQNLLQKVEGQSIILWPILGQGFEWMYYGGYHLLHDVWPLKQSQLITWIHEEEFYAQGVRNGKIHRPPYINLFPSPPQDLKWNSPKQSIWGLFMPRNVRMTFRRRFNIIAPFYHVYMWIMCVSVIPILIQV